MTARDGLAGRKIDDALEPLAQGVGLFASVGSADQVTLLVRIAPQIEEFFGLALTRVNILVVFHANGVSVAVDRAGDHLPPGQPRALARDERQQAVALKLRRPLGPDVLEYRGHQVDRLDQVANPPRPHFLARRKLDNERHADHVVV